MLILKACHVIGTSPPEKKLKHGNSFLVQLNGHEKYVTDLIRLQVIITKKILRDSVTKCVLPFKS